MTDPYRRRARIYEAVVDRINRPLHQLALRTRPAQAGARVLDIGCGTGAQLEHYLEIGCEVSGVDLSPAMLARARARLGEAADLHLADATDLPFPDDRFDLLLASMFLHELSGPVRQRVLAEAARVLATDGAAVIVDFGVGDLSLRGRLRRAVSTAFELAAGRAHFRAFRGYVGEGGLPTALHGSPLVIERERRLGGGDLTVVVAGLP